MVVDLSVVGHHPAATGRDHWLCSARSEIDDGQTPVTEGHSGSASTQTPLSSGPRCSRDDAMVDARAPSRSPLVDAAGSRMPAIPHMPGQPGRRVVMSQTRPATETGPHPSGELRSSPASKLTHGPAVVGVLAEATPDAVPEAMEDRLALHVPRGLLQMAGRVGHVPHVPRGASVSPGQQDGVPSVVIRPPGFAFVCRAVRSKASARPADVCCSATARADTASTNTSNPPCRTRQKKSKSSRPKNQSGSGTMPASKTGRASNVAPQLATSTGTSSYGLPDGGTRFTVWAPRPTNRRP